MEIDKAFYLDMIDYAQNIVNKKTGEVIFEAIDIVHEAIIKATTIHDSDEFKILVRKIAIQGPFYRCAHVPLEHIGAPSNLNVYSQFDEKICKKCKAPKYIIYDFYKRSASRRGSIFYYYEDVCIACTIKHNNSLPKTDDAREKDMQTHNKWITKSIDTLNDYYIISVICAEAKRKTGFKRERDTVTQKEIKAKRAQIIAIRNGQISKRSKKTKDEVRLQNNAKSRTKFEKNSISLSDTYIKQVIYNYKKKKGIIIKRDSITPQEIALKRQEIIAKRAKQFQKGRNKE